MTPQPQPVDLPAALEKATSLLRQRLPDPEFRDSVLKIFAKAIQFIHSRNPNCWGINFGKVGPYLLVEHELALYPNGQEKKLAVHVYLKKMEPAVRSLLNENGVRVKEDVKDLWSEVILQLPEQEYLFEQIWPAHMAYLEDKLRYDLHTTSIAPHLRKGAGLVEYIRRNNIDPSLPQPGYVKTSYQPVNQLPGVSLDNLVNSFAKQGLSFSRWEVATFYTALQTKGFVILSGISGMGKTKLAQAFARLMHQPLVIPKNLIKISVQTSMLRWSRIIIPKSSFEFFTPPNPGEAIDVRLSFGAQTEICTLKHRPESTRDYTQLQLKGKARFWFMEHFKTDDVILLEPQLDDEDKITGFKLGTEKDFAEVVAVETNGDPDNYLFLSVRPDWRDSKSLLGYFNPIDQQYHSTPFLEFIKKARDSYQRKEQLAWFLLLDEMNLARVEYYFSDFLSVLESGRDNDGWSREPLRLDLPYGAEGSEYQREIRLPPNLYIIGTVNIDETTHAFSPKVLDRAFTMELSHADFSNYPMSVDEVSHEIDDQQRTLLFQNFSRGGIFAQLEKNEIYDLLRNDADLRNELTQLYDRLKPFDLHFGYRVVDEICEFLINADQSGFFESLGEDQYALDAAVLMKVLPKFHGSRTKLEEPLKEVLSWCLSPKDAGEQRVKNLMQASGTSISALIAGLTELPYQYPNTAHRVIRMIRSLYTTGFAAFG